MRSAIFAILIVVLCPIHAHAREITLFDQTGPPVAYIDTSDELTVYLWDGDPVAYLEDESMYGFNGKHLGWFEKGLVWDHRGRVVGFTKGALEVLTKFEPFKSFKEFKPFKSFKDLAPLKPSYKAEWSITPLMFFLSAGGT